ncbi:hypothetical protein N7G274_010067 [Stereocaulon virgatum]|uniref:Uncharacterized protein n=1 Tax=Stereocaulon virgatum TaxID=373712 RepID=A0ABR3ZXF6_9LECA
MGSKDIPSEELWKKAAAKGYRHGVHRAEDCQMKKKPCGDKNRYDQDCALKYYDKWIASLEHGRLNAGDLSTDSPSAVNVPGAMEPRRLEEGSSPLDIATIKDFLQFKASISDGRIDEELERSTADSLNTFAEWFFAGFARVTGNPIPEEDRQEVYDGSVVNKKKAKYLFGEKEFTRFTTTFWTVDDKVFTHPRNKVQIPFILSVFFWTAARIGAFFPGKKNGSKKGLQYRDIELVLLRIPSGGWKAIYRIDQRWVKNNRDPENVVFGASTSQHGTLLHGDTQFLLALAIGDHAIWGVNTLDDLWQLQIPDGDDKLHLRCNDSVMNLPILRHATVREGVTDEPLLKSNFDRILKSVLEHSGFVGSATVHAIRRFVGKKINARYTEVERSQHVLLSLLN